MKYSSFIIAAAAVILISVFQQSNASATFVIQNGYSNATDIILEAKNIAMSGVSAAKQLVPTQPAAAKEKLQRSLLEAGAKFYIAGISLFQSLGRALALTNDKAKKELQEASMVIQKTGYGAIVAIKSTDSLINQGFNTADITTLGIDVVLETIKTAIDAVINAIKISHQHSMMALKNAESTTSKFGVQKLITDGKNSSQDSDALVYINKINEAAEKCLHRNGDTKIVNELRKSLLNAINDILKASAKGKQIMENIRNHSNIEHKASIVLVSQLFERVKDKLHMAVADIFLAFGFAGQKYGSQSLQKIGFAITTVDQAKVDLIYNFDSAEGMAIFGLVYQVNSPALGVPTAVEVLRFGTLAFLQKIADAAVIAFDVL